MKCVSAPRNWLIVGAMLWLAPAAMADLSLPTIFGDGMVLQRQRPVPVWGKAEPGQKVTVSIADQSVTATAGTDGRWRVEFEPMEAGGPHELRVESANATLKRRDVLVGEVWLLSGQSNMVMGVKGLVEAEKTEATEGADRPTLRLYHHWRGKGAGWRPSTAENALGFSAVGYFFGAKLHDALKDVPIGLVLRARGGIMIQSFISDEGLRRDPIVRRRYAHRWDQFRADREQLEAAMKRRPEFARADLPAPQSGNAPTAQFDALIRPIIPYRIRGAVWYQGESDAWGFPVASSYERILRALIEDWRAQWRDPSMYFVICQLANYQTSRLDPPVSDAPWPRVQEAQARVARDANVGLAVALDAEAKSIHPRRKLDLGRRAARRALADVYGHDLVARGPTLRSMTVRDGQAVLRFDHADGLTAKGGKVEGLIIAGPDRRFYWADARIEGRTVVASSEHVPDPVAVRYAYWEASPYSLYNGAGLPAPLFRTDDWSWDPPKRGEKTFRAGHGPEPGPAEPLDLQIEHTYAEPLAPTRAGASWSEAGLQLRLICERAGGATPSNEADRRDHRKIWAGDYVEVVIDADPDDPFYHRFAVTPDGTIYDARGFLDASIYHDILSLGMLGMYRDIDPQWNPTWQAAAEITPTQWSATMTFPWETIGLAKPQPGQTLKLQITRGFGPDGPVANWAQTGRGRSTGAMRPRHHRAGFREFHEPQRFGTLKLIE